jgi:hypothetical protein
MADRYRLLGAGIGLAVCLSTAVSSPGPAAARSSDAVDPAGRAPTAVASDHGDLLRTRKVRVHLKVRPAAAEVGAAVKLKGRVTGKRGRTKVTLFAGGVELKKLKTKRSGAFSTTALVPADRTFQACVKRRCARRVVQVPPEKIDYAWTWDGYSFSTRVGTFEVVGVSVNTVDQKPGEAKIYFSVSGSGAVSNRTPGRNASPDWTAIQPVYPQAGALCANTGTGTNRSTSAMETSNGDFMASYTPTGYCYLTSTTQARVSSVGTLSPGATKTVGYAYDALGDSFEASFIVPESALSAVIADLTHPSFWLLSRGLGGPENEFAVGVCHAGIPVVATTTAGLGVCAQQVQ